MLEAEDSVILRRYKENRRRHPLLEEGSAGLEAAIRTERKLLEPLRLWADYRIDTSFINHSTAPGAGGTALRGRTAAR